MTSSLDKPNIAVVGAGIAGLVAAYALALKGAKVTIFERSQTLGGRAKTSIHDGFFLNLGPHALYRGGAAYKTLQEWDIAPTGSPPKLSGAKAIFQKEIFQLPTDLFSLLTTKLLSLTDKVELLTFLAGLPKLNTANLIDQNLDHWLSTALKSERVRNVVEALVRLSTYAHAGGILSAGAGLEQLAMANSAGVIYVDHGWQTIIEDLKKLLAGKVEIRTSEAIKAVKENDSNVELSCKEEKKEFDAVVLALPPDVVSELTGADFADGLIRSRVACLDVCLKRLPNPEITFALGIDEPLYYSVHSHSAELAPQGTSLIQLAYYLKPDDDSDVHQERLTELLNRLQPGWENELIFKRFLPDMVASYGISLAKHIELPSNSFSRTFVCGDWADQTRTGFLADASARSALLAAERALKISGRVLSSS